MFTKNSSPFGLELLIRMKIVWGIVKERCGGVLKLSFFQNMEFALVLEKTQSTGNIKNRHAIVI